MDFSLLALGTLEQIRDIATGIGVNVASQILMNMAREEGQSLPASFEPDLKRQMTDCVIGCLHGEPDEGNRVLLVRCLFDDATLHEIVGLFLERRYDEAQILAVAKSRLPTGIDWEQAEGPLARGVKQLVERFKYAVANNQILVNRLLLDVWERDERQAAETREILHANQNALASIQKSVADFPTDKIVEAVKNASLSTLSPVLSSAGGFPADSSAAVAFLKDDFETALNELKIGSAKKARAGFETVVARLEKLGVETDKKLYFRAKCNLGVAAFASGEPKEFAIQCLESAFPFSEGSIKGRINLALARSLQGREDEAITLLSAILIEDPGNFVALIHRGDSYLRTNRREEALADFRKAIPESQENQMSLASAFLAANAYEEAASAAEALLKSHPDDPWGRMIISTAIGIPIIERINADHLASGYRPSDDLKEIRRAMALLEEALPWVRNCDRPDKLVEVLSNLAAFHSVLGDHKVALRFADEGAALPDCGEAVHRNRFLAAALSQEYEKALDSARALEATMPFEDAVVRQIEALKGLRKFSEGLELVEKVKAAAGGNPVSAYLRVLEVDLVLGLPDLERAEKLSAALNEDYPADAIAWLSTAELARNRDAEKEEMCLRKAVECADVEGLKLQSRGMLGQFLGRTARWKESLELLLPSDKSQQFETPHLVEIAVCLFNQGQHLEALRFAERRLQDGYDAAACHLAMQSCLAMVELEKARGFAEMMQKSDPRNQVAAWGVLAHLEFRLNRPEQARRILVSAIAKEENSKLLLLLCEICQHLGRHEEALGHAIRALALASGADRINCHRAIVHVSLCLPETARIERPIRRQIRKSIASLTREDGSGVTAMPLEPDFAALKKMLQAQQRAASEGQRLFSERGLPIYVLTHMAGRDIHSVWRGLVGGNGLRVNMALGSEQEQASQQKLAGSCKGVVLDATALLTFRHLGLLEKLPEIFGRVVVSFPVYEQFLGLLQQARNGPPSAGWIGMVDEHIHLQEFEPGAPERTKAEFLEPIISFMESIERVGYQEPAVLNEAASFFKLCDNSVWASVQVACQTGLPLLCDDVGTLQMAKMSSGVEGFCSQTALRLGDQKAVLTDRQYAEAVMRLFESNYYFVSDDVHSLVTYLENHEWVLTPSVRALFERFDTGVVTRVTACRIMGGVLAHAWLRASHPDADGQRWVNYICERLRSVGDASENFVTALYGTVEMYFNTPDLFFSLVIAITKVEWLPNDLVSEIKVAGRLIMRAMGSDRVAWAEHQGQRWRELARAIR